MLKIYETYRLLAEQLLAAPAFYVGQMGTFYKYDTEKKDYVYREVIDALDVPYINFYIASETEFKTNPAIIQLQCVMEYRCNTDIDGLGMVDTQNAGILGLRKVIRDAERMGMRLQNDIAYIRVARDRTNTMQATGVMASFTIVVANYLNGCC